ncbi:dehydrodolichyl diphosphate synthase complex subunit nus1-like [Dreissena polymorpha]|uniref:ditrans,polycis-polyprenyl diphosphate synthase [(2E,6E)-farnesyldiphosphate specific] n=1 Tax=Dreissena polymorpha TaxID=45954 RepID=A0A9D4D327_DREPO|nr:dehydrodolichyl diphosphate synthase complex subunit nus1-like [Dreissena polymorpha]KAH3736428.1 hypothetical protein DPMN_042991 [Dreissena polymorpha]
MGKGPFIVILRIIHYVVALTTFVKQWLLKYPVFPFKKTDIASVQSDARKLKKLPLHLGLLVLEDEFSYADIARLILWSSAMGISFVSVYDVNGLVKFNEKVLAAEVQKQKGLRTDSEKIKTDIYICCGIKRVDAKRLSSPQTTVFLLSMDDGFQSIVNITRSIYSRVKCKQMKVSEIDPHSLDTVFQEETGYPDPDMVIRFGQTESLLGFMPWQVRLTEILSLPSHQCLEYKTFRSVLLSYGNTQQRFGK